MIVLWAIALLALPGSVIFVRWGYRRLDGSPWLFWFIVVLASIFAVLVLLGGLVEGDRGWLRSIPAALIVFSLGLATGLYPLMYWRGLQRADQKGIERRERERKS